MASTWLTDVASGVADYYRRTQPRYNAARNRAIASEAEDRANASLGSMLVSRFPDANPLLLEQPNNLIASMALDNGIPAQEMPNSDIQPAPMISSAPIVAPEQAKSPTPMLSVNPMYRHEAADVARMLMPSGPGSAEYKQSSSASGATRSQADESYKQYRKSADELTSKSKELAIKKAKLALMMQAAPSVRASMYGTEDADLFDNSISNLSKEVEADDAAAGKAQLKVAELDQKIAVSNKQAETQQAKIEVARAAKTTNDEWRRKVASGKLDLDWAKLHIQNLQNYQKNLLDKYRIESNFASSTGGTQQLFATQKVSEMMQHLARGQAVLDRLNAMGAATGGAILDKDRDLAARMTTEFFDDANKTAQSNDFELRPAEPEKGFLQNLFSGAATGERGPVPSATSQYTPSLAALAGAQFNPNMGGPGGDYATVAESGTGSAPAPVAVKKAEKRVSKLKSGPGPKPSRGAYQTGAAYVAAVSAWRKAGGKD